MSKKEEVKVEFETITPIWTGDAWGENSKLQPSSIMGSLRFWFEVYCRFAGIKVNDYKTEHLDYEKFIEKKKKDLTKSDFEILRELNISLPSILFGCTGWKSRIKIGDIVFNKEKLYKQDIDFSFLHHGEGKDKVIWWSNKILFNGKRYINTLNRICITLLVETAYLKEFKKFLKFYQEKPILIGGKKAFGLGFVKIKSNQVLDVEDIEVKKDVVIWDKVSMNNSKTVLGYNIKYFLRQKEKPKNRVFNFGKQGKASKYYFSLIENGECHIITFNTNENQLNKYKSFLYSKPKNKQRRSVNDLKNFYNNR